MADDRAAYYEQLYPFCVVFDWLTATNNLAGNPGSREFAFRFDSGAMKRFQKGSDNPEPSGNTSRGDLCWYVTFERDIQLTCF